MSRCGFCAPDPKDHADFLFFVSSCTNFCSFSNYARACILESSTDLYFWLIYSCRFWSYFLEVGVESMANFHWTAVCHSDILSRWAFYGPPRSKFFGPFSALGSKSNSVPHVTWPTSSQGEKTRKKKNTTPASHAASLPREFPIRTSGHRHVPPPRARLRPAPPPLAPLGGRRRGVLPDLPAPGRGGPAPPPRASRLRAGLPRGRRRRRGVRPRGLPPLRLRRGPADPQAGIQARRLSRGVRVRVGAVRGRRRRRAARILRRSAGVRSCPWNRSLDLGPRAG